LYWLRNLLASFGQESNIEATCLSCVGIHDSLGCGRHPVHVVACADYHAHYAHAFVLLSCFIMLLCRTLHVSLLVDRMLSIEKTWTGLHKVYSFEWKG